MTVHCIVVVAMLVEAKVFLQPQLHVHLLYTLYSPKCDVRFLPRDAMHPLY